MVLREGSGRPGNSGHTNSARRAETQTREHTAAPNRCRTLFLSLAAFRGALLAAAHFEDNDANCARIAKILQVFFYEGKNRPRQNAARPPDFRRIYFDIPAGHPQFSPRFTRFRAATDFLSRDYVEGVRAFVGSCPFVAARHAVLAFGNPFEDRHGFGKSGELKRVTSPSGSISVPVAGATCARDLWRLLRG